MLASSRHVVISLHGQVLADSRAAVAVYETHLPLRWYLPVEDVSMDLLTPSDTRSTCADKGLARSLSLPDAPDIAWTYDEPLGRRPTGAGDGRIRGHRVNHIG